MEHQKKEGIRPSVKYADLELAMSFISNAYMIDAAAYISRKTGEIFWESSEMDDEYEIPDDLGDSSLYATVPHPNDLDLGKRLVMRFTTQALPGHYDQVSAIFRRRGAYSHYKELLDEIGLLEEWYAFENSATETALREWAEDEGFMVEPPIIQKATDRICQFKIELEGTNPSIWRRIQVPENYSFWDLHVAIQDAMGWLDYHLHAFRVIRKEFGEAVEIGIPDDYAVVGEPEVLAGWETSIADHIKEVGATAVYEYDFGDGWEHLITKEGILLSEIGQEYPRCIDGAQACPPEDCGGVSGYYRLLEVLADPADEEHGEMLEWLGGKYEPRDFSPSKVKFDDPAKRWNKAFTEDL